MRALFLTLGTLTALAAASAPLGAQDAKPVETRITRVHLKNGNTVDGRLVSSGSNELVLRLSNNGEVSLSREDIQSIEIVKMRTMVDWEPAVKREPVIVRGPVATAAVEAPVPAAASEKGKQTGKPAAPAINPDLRTHIDEVLGQMERASIHERKQMVGELTKEASAAPYLASRLPDMHEEMLPFLGKALWELRDPDMAPYVFAALDSERPAVLQQAILLSARLEGSWTSSKIRRFLSDPRAPLRAATAEALKTMGDAGSLLEILPMLEDKEPLVRAVALNACLELGRRTGRMELVAGRLEECMVRAEGCALGELLVGAGRSGQKSLSKPLARFLRDADPAIRAKAAAALTELGDFDAVPALVQALVSEQASVAQLALLRAGMVLQVREFIDPTLPLLKSGDEEVRQTAREALRVITRQNFGDDFEAWSRWWDAVRPR